MAGIYIHIPFCKVRCAYCGFYSTECHDESIQSNYVSALIKEFDSRYDYIKGEKVDTIYIGGGTPSFISTKHIQRLLDHILRKIDATDEKLEITMECNPDDMDERKIQEIASLPVNRVSMGVQTFDSQLLNVLGRRHNNEEVYFATETLRKYGISNISLDLMYGLPRQNIEMLNEDIERILDLAPCHISTYMLSYEEETPLWRNLRKGIIREVDEELGEKMYFTIISKLKERGYEHYELSNFALPGKRSRHNSSYWHEKKYLGLGAGAHSYDGDSRQWNIPNVNRYTHNVMEGSSVVDGREELSEYDKYNDIITTTLRTCEGINLKELSKRFPRRIMRKAQESAEKLLYEGELESISNGNIRIAEQYLFVSDAVMREMIVLED